MASVTAPSTVPSEGVNYFFYQPVKGASVAFAILFLISGGMHLWQNCLKFRSWRIGFLLPWAAALFVAGFILREYGTYHTDNLNIFIASTVLLFCAPPVYNGANYFIFGRALYYLPYLAPLHPGRVWTTFIALDGVADIIAAQGVSRAANVSLTPAEHEAGWIMVKISLFLLLAMFLGFFYLNVLFHYRAVKKGLLTQNLKIIMYELYVSNLLILLRNTFRTAALFYTESSVANGEEWPLWVFEFVPMIINTYMLNVWPPAKYLPANHKIYLAMDGETEIEGPGMIDKRPFLVTLFDPFDLGGLIRKSDQKNRFWLTDGIGGPRGEQADEIAPKQA